jgi:hypothetical protein
VLNYSNQFLYPREPQTWSVFDNTGAFVSDVVTPGAIDITHIGRDWILGIWKDAEDVDHVRIHRLSRFR